MVRCAFILTNYNSFPHEQKRFFLSFVCMQLAGVSKINSPRTRVKSRTHLAKRKPSNAASRKLHKNFILTPCAHERELVALIRLRSFGAAAIKTQKGRSELLHNNTARGVSHYHPSIRIRTLRVGHATVCIQYTFGCIWGAQSITWGTARRNENNRVSSANGLCVFIYRLR